MANDKYYKQLSLTDAVTAFKNNRVNRITYSGINSYIGINNNDANGTYAYARYSSPTLSSTDDMGGVQCVTLTNGTAYVIYKNYSYTYTENVEFRNCYSAFIAYDFIKSNNGLNNGRIKLNGYIEHICYGDYTVNEKSHTSYTIMNETNTRSVHLQDELSLSKGDFTYLLGSSTYTDCSSYINFSYIDRNIDRRTGYIYNDGCNRITNINVNDFHVWSLSSTHNSTSHWYKENDTEQINPTVKLNVGQKLKQAIITNGKHVSSYFMYRYNDTGYDTPDIRYNSKDKTCYVQMGNQTFDNFYKNAYAYYDGNYTDNAFSYCYTWPATRWNQQSYNFYETVYVKSKINGSYNDNNVNTACYIRTISYLPVGLLYCNSNPGTYLPITSYVYEGPDLSSAPSSANGIDHYTVNFSYKMINSDGTLSDYTYNITVKTSGTIPFRYDSETKRLYPADSISFDIDSLYFKSTPNHTPIRNPSDKYHEIIYYPTELYCPSNFLDNKIVTGLTVTVWTYGQYLSYTQSLGGNKPWLKVVCDEKTSTHGGFLQYIYSCGDANIYSDDYTQQNGQTAYFYYMCRIEPTAKANPRDIRITSIDINFYTKHNIND